MKVETFDDPFSHFTFEDFFSSEAFTLISAFSRMEVPPLDKGERNNLPHHMIPIFLHDLILPFAYELERMVRGDNKTHSSYNLEFDTITPGFEYPVHQDDPAKDFVFIVYLSDKGKGTCLHSDPSKEPVKIAPWVKNGGCGFLRTENSWHSFNTHGLVKPRRTLIVNLRK